MSSQPNPPADLSRHGLDNPHILESNPNYEERMAETMGIINEGNMVFRAITEKEVKEFRQNARNGYKPFTPIEGIWHPIYQLECVRINHESSSYRVEVSDESG